MFRSVASEDVVSGCGPGLAITRSIDKAHTGEILACNRSEGSLVSISLQTRWSELPRSTGHG